MLNLLIGILLVQVPGCLGYPAECTVMKLLDGFDSESQLTGKDLVENQIKFNENCRDNCTKVDMNGVVREQCSEESSVYQDDMTLTGYGVYKCPAKDDRYYIFNYGSCRLKPYTLCDDFATYSDENLTAMVKNLFCECDSQSQFNITTQECDLKEGSGSGGPPILCKKADTPHANYTYIKQYNTCTGFDYCEDYVDRDQRYNNCTDYGVYCKDKNGNEVFYSSSFVCNGQVECNEGEDEKNCDTSKGMYCNSTDNELKYITNDKLCDRNADCSDEVDESEEKCGNVTYCKNPDGSGELMYMTVEMMCNGSSECEDYKDEQFNNCGVYEENGAPCDNGTKWILQKYLCTGRNLCDDGMDMDEERWNCSQHELCNATEDGSTGGLVLCNSTLFCRNPGPGLDSVLEKNCNYCENGTALDPDRCRDSDNGVVCYKTELFDPKEIFVAKDYFCDGNKDCDDGEDETNCYNGYYCSDKLVTWEMLCNGDERCDDNSDEAYCDSEFFDFIRDEHKVVRGEEVDFEYQDYLHINFTQFGLTEDNFEQMTKHSIFECQEAIYNMVGEEDIKKVLKNVIDKWCIPLEKFSCHRIYDTRFTLSRQISRSRLCSVESIDCKASERPEKVNSCLQTTYCYLDSMRCDGENDCGYTGGLGADERSCYNSGFRCDSNTTIEDIYVCDGYIDCTDSKADEAICDNDVVDVEENTCTDDENKEVVDLYRSIPANNLTDEMMTDEIGSQCSCDKLYGTHYLAAVCSGAEGQCTGDTASLYNKTLCYPEENGTWFIKTYQEMVEKDDSCLEGSETIVTLQASSDGKTSEYVVFVRESSTDPYYDRTVYCADEEKRKDGKCGVSISKMCDFQNDCGDWSDEKSEVCINNFMCTSDDGNITKVIKKANTCNGVSDCSNSQDECLDECNEGLLSNTKQILGSWGLLVVVWVFGVVSFFFNLYMIVAMSCSALTILNKMPHRFIYRLLVATIAFGDILVSIYLVILAVVDSGRTENYCEVKESWLTGHTCVVMGVLSTLGNHVSIFAMLTLSFFRLKTVVNYLWPRSLTRTHAIKIATVMVVGIVICAFIIATIPLAGGLKDYFVTKYYFPNRRGAFGDGSKKSVVTTLKDYNVAAKLLPAAEVDNLTEGSSWEDIMNVTATLFNGSTLAQDEKRYSFYSSHGVCLFNYLNEPTNSSFAFVISIITVNIVCFLAIIFSYVYIWKIGTKSKSTERQLQRKLSIAVFLNIICRTPLFIMCVANAIDRDGENSAESEACIGTCLYYRYMSVFVIPINSVLNPFINCEVPLLDLFGIRYVLVRAGLMEPRSSKGAANGPTTMQTMATKTTTNL